MANVSEKIITKVLQLSPDIVLLQESHIPFTRNRSQIATKLQAHGYNCTPDEPASELPTSHLDHKYRLGTETLSKFDVSNFSQHKLPNPGLMRDNWVSHDKFLTKTDISYEGQCVSVINVHLLPFHKFSQDADSLEYNKYWKSILDVFRNNICEPYSILGGDLNLTSRNKRFREIKSLGLQPLVYTDWTDSGTFTQLDWIMATKNIRSHSTQVGRHDYSDHKYLAAEITLI